MNILVAGITAFYMFRLYFSIFWNKTRHYHHTPHESPYVMTIPLMFLALGSVFAGYHPFQPHGHLRWSCRSKHTCIWDIAIPSVLIGRCRNCVCAMMMYYRKTINTLIPLLQNLGAFYRWSYNKFYIDEIYLFVTKKIIFQLYIRTGCMV